MNLNERIAKVIEYSGFTSSEFADEVDVQRSSISHITSGRNKPSLEFITKIKTRFPEIQWDWLITETGEMLKNEQNPAENEAKEDKPRTTSLPDLFSLIDDDSFGYTEREDKISRETPRELIKTEQLPDIKKIDDSQRLEQAAQSIEPQTNENQSDKVKRIVLFYESGKFESFEP